MSIILIHQDVWPTRRNESPANNADVTINNSTLFKDKSSLTGITEADGTNGKATNPKTAGPLCTLNHFWRPLEIPLINCQIHLKLNCCKNCIF